jgi:hypothetical protein
MLIQLAADLRRREVRMVVAHDIGQVRDMLALAAQTGGSPEYFRSVQDAVNAVRAGPPSAAGMEG